MAQSGPCDKRLKVREGEDLISNLPEAIIGHILSFLPTEDAVRTSVLAKKWTFMWRLITDLYFDETVRFSTKRTKKQNFVKFVNRILLHITSSTLQSFTLTTCTSFDSCFVDSWISAVLLRKVQKLNINCWGNLILPSHSLFQCKSLVELKLCLPNCTVKFPASVCLPNLELLSLSRITLISDADSLTHPKELILTFPILKVFMLSDCKWSCAIKVCSLCLNRVNLGGIDIPENLVFSDESSAYNATVGISCSYFNVGAYPSLFRMCMLLKQLNQMKYLKLRNIKIHIEEQVEDVFANFPEFRMLCSLDITNIPGKVLLGFLHKSPSLETLVLDEIHNEVQVEDAFANLPEFRMLCSLNISNIPKKVLSGLLQKSPCLETLVLNNVEDASANLPEFRMLRSLNISNISGKVLLRLLHKSPSLETLVLKGVFPKFDKKLLNFALIPRCLQSSLQVVKFERFFGAEHEICLAKFLMENGAALEPMSMKKLKRRLKWCSMRSTV